MLVWTETQDELTLLFTRAQQAQNDKYKKILITLIGLKLTFRAKHRYFTITITQFTICTICKFCFDIQI